MCCWLEDMEGEAKGERQEEARPAKNYVLDHNGLNGGLARHWSGWMDMTLQRSKSGYCGAYF